MTRTTVIMMFLPVLDAAVVKFLKRQRGVSHVLWILDPALVKDCCPEAVSCETLDPNDAASAVRSWNLFGHVKVADRRMFRFLSQPCVCIVMPDDQASHAIVKCHFTTFKTVFVPL